ISRELDKLKYETLTDRFAEICEGSPEAAMHAKDGFTVEREGAAAADGGIAPAQMGKQEALARFTVDLTEQARRGEIDPVIGRDDEIRQIIDILMRRRQNNPILT